MEKMQENICLHPHYKEKVIHVCESVATTCTVGARNILGHMGQTVFTHVLLYFCRREARLQPDEKLSSRETSC